MLCQCGRCTDESTFVCEGCNKVTAECFGAADDLPNHCDDCWNALHKTRKTELTKVECERCDFVDNSINELLMKIQTKGIDATEFADNRELIADIRDLINDNWRDLYSQYDFNEQEFYPFIEE